MSSYARSLVLHQFKPMIQIVKTCICNSISSFQTVIKKNFFSGVKPMSHQIVVPNLFYTIAILLLFVISELKLWNAVMNNGQKISCGII